MSFADGLCVFCSFVQPEHHNQIAAPIDVESIELRNKDTPVLASQQAVDGAHGHSNEARHWYWQGT